MAKEELSIAHPRENPHLFGHDAALARFKEEAARGKLHHAYLITGPKGIGKATFAYHAARHMLGQGAASAAPSLSLFGDAPPTPKEEMTPEHPIFRRVAAGSHADLLVLSPSVDNKKGAERADITAEEAREVPSFLSLTPAEGDWRIVIVDAVDQLNTHAANALLKILEEPPARALLLLVCHAPGGTLATIRSRCRVLPLSLPTMQEFERILEHAASSIPRADYAGLYALSYGSAGTAITLAGHNGIARYTNWLAALEGNAAALQSLEQEASAAKSPQFWQLLADSWRTALYRLSVAPTNVVFRGELEQLEALRTTFLPHTLSQWHEEGEKLIRYTETFHLDKRLTVRLLANPDLLSQTKVA